MKICIWRTGHEIADRVAEAVYEGLGNDPQIQRNMGLTSDEQGAPSDLHSIGDVHICYGVLRGTAEILRRCSNEKIPWLHIDKGYWKPGHFDGYYRISLNGTQQTFGFDKLDPDYARWDALGLSIEPCVERDGNNTLMIPPTDHVCDFFGIKLNDWVSAKGYEEAAANFKNYNAHVRHKSDPESLEDWLNACTRVTTFNSSVGWEALRQGIPVFSDPTHSIVGAYVNHFSKDGDNSFASRIHKDVNMRRDLFALMAGLQLTLEEIRSGLLWPLINRLLSTLDLTPAKP